MHALVLNYYHPWVYAGAERYNQLAREELAQGREQAFVYVSDAGAQEEIDRLAKTPEYDRLALYRFVAPNRAAPVSPHAVRVSGGCDVNLSELAKRFRPRYVRSHFPSRHFLDALAAPVVRDVPFLYDVIDLWSAFPSTPWGDCTTEDHYVQRSDALVVVSKALQEGLASAAAPAYLVPNAVDRRFLELIAPSSASRRPVGQPKRVLYMGSMGGSWFDWDLVIRLVRDLADHRFTFLGSELLPPEEMRNEAARATYDRYQELAAQPNAEMVLEVPHDAVAPWLRQADVGLIPFKANALTRAVSPLKVFEYLGAGSVVVQLGMPDIAPYPGVRTARDQREFIELVARSDRETITVAEARAMARFAGANTWATRVAQFDSIVEALGG